MADRKKPPQEGNQITENVLPDDISQALEGLPVDKRETIEKTLVTQFAMITSRSSPEFEISRKITSDHITKLLDTQSKSMEYTYKDEQHKRWFYVALIALVSAVVVVLVLILKDKPDVLEKVLIGLGGVIAGAAGGYGLKASQDKN